MARTKKTQIFIVGGNLLRPTPDDPEHELRFEAGQELPEDLTKEELASLKKHGAIGHKEDVK